MDAGYAVIIVQGGLRELPLMLPGEGEKTVNLVHITGLKLNSCDKDTKKN